MRRVNPDTLEVEEVVKDNKHYVYVLCESGSWDYEQSTDIEVYKNFKHALAVFYEKVKSTKHDLREWCDEDEIDESYDVDEENEQASYSGCEEDDYERLHCEIYISKKEVI